MVAISLRALDSATIQQIYEATFIYVGGFYTQDDCHSIRGCKVLVLNSNTELLYVLLSLLGSNTLLLLALLKYNFHSGDIMLELLSI